MQQILEINSKSHEILEEYLLDKYIKMVLSDEGGQSESCEKLLTMAKRKIKDAQLHLVRSLQFPGINDREEGIPDARQQTFEWIFRDSINTSRPWKMIGGRKWAILD